MKIKLSQFIADYLVDYGIRHNFTVTGGGAMHLNDAFGHKEGMECIYNHHEQACAIAAEAYARLTGNIALVCVTSGPGGTNAITGVLGGWLDSVPMLVISGQVKRETTLWSTDVPLRQLGDQEFNIVDVAKEMTKYAVMVTEPKEIKYHLEKALYLAKNGRPGPVWLDIPLDVQAAVIDTDELKGYEPSDDTIENPIYDEGLTKDIISKIEEAKRPVILAGTGIRTAGAYEEFLKCVDKLGIPVVTAWNAHDLLEYDNPLFVGKPGTVGTRGGNFVVQNCDLLLVLGCRMNIRMISYNKHQFAKNAYKIVVDIDENELKKPTVNVDMPIHANVKDVMNSLTMFDGNIKHNESHMKWLKWCKDIDAKYPAAKKEYFNINSPLNPYAFLDKAFDAFKSDEVIICGNGSACVMTFQTAKIKSGQRLFTNSGCAAMGYGFPAAIGACIARDNKRTVCIDGDGSFQMNLQELQTVVYNRLDMKIVYLNNNGYHSIRQTQTNLFNPPMVGVCDGTGISFPDMERIAYAYDIPYVRIDSLTACDEKLSEALNMEGPVIIEAIVDPKQNFEPKLSSKVHSDGTITSPELDDMFPFLPEEEYRNNKKLDF